MTNDQQSRQDKTDMYRALMAALLFIISGLFFSNQSTNTKLKEATQNAFSVTSTAFYWIAVVPLAYVFFRECCNMPNIFSSTRRAPEVQANTVVVTVASQPNS